MTRKGGRRATILLAEDDSTMLELTAILLTRLGHDVITAADGDTALKIFEEASAPIHLVISDGLMPGLKGPQFLRAVRSMSPSTATLLISGTMPPSEAGTSWLMKPFRPEKLATLVQELLEGCDFARIKREQSARPGPKEVSPAAPGTPGVVPRSTT